MLHHHLLHLLHYLQLLLDYHLEKYHLNLPLLHLHKILHFLKYYLENLLLHLQLFFLKVVLQQLVVQPLPQLEERVEQVLQIVFQEVQYFMQEEVVEQLFVNQEVLYQEV